MSEHPATFLSLFSGIGGFDLGLERAGWQCVGQVEIDSYCNRVLAKHWPDVPRWGDICEVDPDDLPRANLIAGGFPCQPVSSAGKRLAQDDPRWLWPQAARLIRHLRPQWVLLENVPGLLVRGMGDVLGDLAASGYDAEWDCIPAAAIGAPHQRDRVWIVAYPGSERHGTQPRGLRGDAVREDGPQHDHQPGGGGATVADPDQQHGHDSRPRAGAIRRNGSAATELPAGQGRYLADPERLGCNGWTGQARSEPQGHQSAGGGGIQDADRGAVQSRRLRWGTPQAGGAEWWAAEPDVGRVAHGIPARLDRLRALGNAVVPQVAELIGRRILEADAYE